MLKLFSNTISSFSQLATVLSSQCFSQHGRVLFCAYVMRNRIDVYYPPRQLQQSEGPCTIGAIVAHLFPFQVFLFFAADALVYGVVQARNYLAQQ